MRTLRDETYKKSCHQVLAIFNHLYLSHREGIHTIRCRVKFPIQWYIEHTSVLRKVTSYNRFE